MHRIVVLGSRGMLGHMVTKVLSQDKTLFVIGTQSSDPTAPNYFNVFDGIGSLEKVGERATYFINCIGMLAGDIKEADAESVARATRLNVQFPHELAAFAGARGARVIHMSTDGVFAPDAGEVTDKTTPNARDLYGRTKREGESSAPNILNVRTSIIGPNPIRGTGLFEWFRAQPDGATIKGFTNHRWRGVTTLQFAEFCRHLISSGHFDVLRQRGLAYHFVPNPPTTKYDLLLAFRDALHKPVTMTAVEDRRGNVTRTLAQSRASCTGCAPISSLCDAIARIGDTGG